MQLQQATIDCWATLDNLLFPCQDVFLKKRSLRKRRVDGLEDSKAFSSAFMSWKSYDLLRRNGTHWFNDEVIHFTGMWLLGDGGAVLPNDSFEFVSPFVTKHVVELHRKVISSRRGSVLYGLVPSLSIIHSYLLTKTDLLKKRFIFFTVSEDDNHWWGMVAVNPWTNILSTSETNATDDRPPSNFVR